MTFLFINYIKTTLFYFSLIKHFYSYIQSIVMTRKLNIKVEDGEIDLSMCDLDEVPVKDLVPFTKAKILDLSNNRLSTIGKNFPSLTHLTRINLSKNQITELPRNFGDLTSLQYLDLYSNQINYLPLSFCRLVNLKWLDLKENPLLSAFAKVAGDCDNDDGYKECAINMVKFMQDINLKLEKEKDAERKQRAIQAKENYEQNLINTKKDKKKKKKAEKISQDSTEYSSEKISETDDHTTKQIQQSSFRNIWNYDNNYCSFLIKFLGWIVIFMIFFILIFKYGAAKFIPLLEEYFLF